MFDQNEKSRFLFKKNSTIIEGQMSRMYANCMQIIKKGSSFISLKPFTVLSGPTRA